MKACCRILLLTTSVVLIALLPFIRWHIEPVKIAKAKTDWTRQVAIQEPVGPDLVLVAPETCEVGELVRLDLSQSKAIGLIWQVIPASTDFEVIDGGKRAVFSSRVGGVYRFIIAGARGDVASLIHHEIIVAGGAPDTGPGPAVSIDQRIVSWSKKVAEYPGKKTHAAGMAGVFRKMAETKDIKTDQILEATALANSAVLSADLEKWVPFLDLLGVELDAMVTASTLTTPEQYRATWLLIANGLDKVSK